MQTLEPKQIDRWLWYLRASLTDLCDVASDWENEHIATKSSWDYEWREEMQRFEILWNTYRAGVMNDDQKSRLLELQRDLEESAPLIESLGLQRPPVLSST